MNPPDHIAGHMHSKTDKALRIERGQWIMAQVAKGHSFGAIGKALGIAEAPARNAARLVGYVKKDIPRKPSYRDHTSCGIKLGTLSPIFMAMPDKARNAILDKCAKTGKSIAQVLADTYLEANP